MMLLWCLRASSWILCCLGYLIIAETPHRLPMDENVGRNPFRRQQTELVGTHRIFLVMLLFLSQTVCQRNASISYAYFSLDCAWPVRSDQHVFKFSCSIETKIQRHTSHCCSTSMRNGFKFLQDRCKVGLFKRSGGTMDSNGMYIQQASQSSKIRVTQK